MSPIDSVISTLESSAKLDSQLMAREQAQLVYRTIMRFLKGEHHSNTGSLQDLLEIPAGIGVDGPRTLKFRRVLIMGQTANAAYAQSVDREDLKVYYDPNWEVVDKLVELLNR